MNSPSTLCTLPEPLAPKGIAGNEALFDRHHPNIFQLRYIPIWTIRDTPLCAVYRLYEIYMTREFVLLRLECEYIWHQSGRKWSLRSIPDPRDPDPARYAMLASIVEELVRAFTGALNMAKEEMGRTFAGLRRILGLPTYDPEATPSWTTFVPPIQEEDLCDLPPDMVRNGRLYLADGGCENFARRNFEAPIRYLYTT